MISCIIIGIHKYYDYTGVTTKIWYEIIFVLFIKLDFFICNCKYLLIMAL